MDSLGGFSGGMPSMSAPSLPSGPLSEEQTTRIKQEGEIFLEKFQLVYLRAYKSKLVQKVKEELQGEDPSPYKLRQAPGNSGPLVVFTGSFVKRGGFIKNWKKRVFIVKSNGSCEYFVNAEDPKSKGAIVLEGYSVNAEPKSEAFNGKEHCFTFEHPDSSKRVWYLCAETAEEKAAGLAAFKQATRVAAGYVNSDKLVGESFKTAYQATRYYYGYYYYSSSGTEEELLGSLLYDRLVSVVVGDILRPLEGAAKDLTVKAVKTLVSGMVSAAWKAMDQAVAKVRPNIEEVLKKALKPIIDLEDKTKETINEKVSQPIISPAVSQVLSPFFSQAVGLLYPVIADAYLSQLEISQDRLDKAFPELTAENEEVVFKNLQKTFDISPATNQLPLKRIEAFLDKIENVIQSITGRNDFGGLSDKLKSYIIESIKPAVHRVFPASIEEDMIRFSKNTVYTFEMDYKESKEPEAAAKGTVSKLEHDLRYSLNQVIQDSLKEFVRKPFDAFVGDQAKDLIAPISDQIPEDMKDFVDPDALLDDILEETLTNAVNESAKQGLIELSAKLTSFLEKKGLPVISDE